MDAIKPGPEFDASLFYLLERKKLPTFDSKLQKEVVPHLYTSSELCNKIACDALLFGAVRPQQDPSPSSQKDVQDLTKEVKEAVMHFLYLRFLYLNGIYDSPSRTMDDVIIDHIYQIGCLDFDHECQFPLARALFSTSAIRRWYRNRGEKNPFKERLPEPRKWTVDVNASIRPTPRELADYIAGEEGKRFADMYYAVKPYRLSALERPLVHNPQKLDELWIKKSDLGGFGVSRDNVTFKQAEMKKYFQERDKYFQSLPGVEVELRESDVPGGKSPYTSHFFANRDLAGIETEEEVEDGSSDETLAEGESAPLRRQNAFILPYLPPKDKKWMKRWGLSGSTEGTPLEDGSSVQSNATVLLTSLQSPPTEERETEEKVHESTSQNQTPDSENSPSKGKGLTHSDDTILPSTPKTPVTKKQDLQTSGDQVKDTKRSPSKAGALRRTYSIILPSRPTEELDSEVPQTPAQALYPQDTLSNTDSRVERTTLKISPKRRREDINDDRDANEEVVGSPPKKQKKSIANQSGQESTASHTSPESDKEALPSREPDEVSLKNRVSSVIVSDLDDRGDFSYSRTISRITEMNEKNIQAHRDELPSPPSPPPPEAQNLALLVHEGDRDVSTNDNRDDKDNSENNEDTNASELKEQKSFNWTLFSSVWKRDRRLE